MANKNFHHYKVKLLWYCLCYKMNWHVNEEEVVGYLRKNRSYDTQFRFYNFLAQIGKKSLANALFFKNYDFIPSDCKKML